MDGISLLNIYIQFPSLFTPAPPLDIPQTMRPNILLTTFAVFGSVFALPATLSSPAPSEFINPEMDDDTGSMADASQSTLNQQSRAAEAITIGAGFGSLVGFVGLWLGHRHYVSESQPWNLDGLMSTQLRGLTRQEHKQLLKLSREELQRLSDCRNLMVLSPLFPLLWFPLYTFLPPEYMLSASYHAPAGPTTSYQTGNLGTVSKLRKET